MKGLKVLIVDDEPLMRLSMLDALEGIGCEVMAAATGTEGLTILGTRQFDIVITDLRLPGADGLTILKACKERSPTTEVILITAHGSVDTAVGAIKLGAYDYITKPFQMDELLLIVERVGKILGLRRENLELKEVLEDRFSFGGILGCNHQMRALLEKIKLVAATDSPVSIVGERGTGKELVAHAIHLNSPRRDQPLIKVCCADLPEALLEAELFGHEKGAFPGRCANDVDGSNWRTREPCLLMISMRSLQMCRQGCGACFRIGDSSVSAGANTSRWTSGSCVRPRMI